MPKGLIFFCCACCILILTVINICVAPIISGAIESNWGNLNCPFEEDNYDNAKKGTLTDVEKKYTYEWKIDECKIKKGMYDLEYAAFIIDIVIGFVCGLLGILHLFEAGTNYISKTGIIGFICGIVGFILTIVYVIFNGLVYTKYYDEDAPIYKTDKDGAFAERVDTQKYKCLYFDEVGNSHSFKAKFSDLIQKQYNYDKDLYNEDSPKVVNCRHNAFECVGEFLSLDSPMIYDGTNECDKLYASDHYQIDKTDNKDKSDRFLTAIILSLFICIANIGLIIFGFLLFKTPSEFTRVESKN